MELCDKISEKLNNLDEASQILARLAGENDGGAGICSGAISLRHSIAGLLQDYHLGISSNSARILEEPDPAEAQQAVYRVVESLDLARRVEREIQKMMEFAGSIGAVYGQITPEMNEAMRLLESAQYIPVEAKSLRQCRSACKCGASYDISANHSEYCCPVCFRVKPLQGTAFELLNTGCTKNPKNKNRNAVMRHYDCWMTRIQAREAKVFSPKLLEAIRNILVRDGDNVQDLDCDRMREILKEKSVSGTKMNDHASLLIVMFGGPAPPQLTTEESENHRRLFVVIINLCLNSGNKSYYPYFIYKIIEIMFDGNPGKLKLLSYIHLQKPETVIRRDREFEDIVKRSDPRDKLFYRPTDPSYWHR